MYSSLAYTDEEMLFLEATLDVFTMLNSSGVCFMNIGDRQTMEVHVVWLKKKPEKTHKDELGEDALKAVKSFKHLYP